MALYAMRKRIPTKKNTHSSNNILTSTSSSSLESTHIFSIPSRIGMRTTEIKSVKWICQRNFYSYDFFFSADSAGTGGIRLLGLWVSNSVEFLSSQCHALLRIWSVAPSSRTYSITSWSWLSSRVLWLQFFCVAKCRWRGTACKVSLSACQ